MFLLALSSKRLKIRWALTVNRPVTQKVIIPVRMEAE